MMLKSNWALIRKKQEGQGFKSWGCFAASLWTLHIVSVITKCIRGDLETGVFRCVSMSVIVCLYMWPCDEVLTTPGVHLAFTP